MGGLTILTWICHACPREDGHGGKITTNQIALLIKFDLSSLESISERDNDAKSTVHSLTISGASMLSFLGYA